MYTLTVLSIATLWASTLPIVKWTLLGLILVLAVSFTDPFNSPDD